MIILGLGSNLGDRLTYLRDTLQLIKQIPELVVQKASPIYQSDALLPENAPMDFAKSYFNLALKCETSLKPFDLLFHLKEIEKKIGRVPNEKWGPRVIDIDILAWDDLQLTSEYLTIPHVFLHERPFALWPLADLVPRWNHPILNKTAEELSTKWGCRFSGEAPFRTQQIFHRIDTPKLIGILNVTPDSFSDGGKFFSAENVLQHAIELVNSGAEIIDIGAESTAPSATPIDAETEWQRLHPILKLLFSEKNAFSFFPKISVDTRNYDVAKKALNFGADWINDVSGLENTKMQSLITSTQCDVVFMHHLKIPEDRRFHLPLAENPVSLVYDFAAKKISELEKLGIDRSRLIFDAGIGFGKLASQSIEILENMKMFSDLGVRLLVGHSRKSFLQRYTTLPAKERDLETVFWSMRLINKVDFFRVHNVGMHARAFKIIFNAS